MIRLRKMAATTLRFLACLPVVCAVAALRFRMAGYLTVSQILALVPGKIGVVWREYWYRRTLDRCGEGLHVDWMAVFRSPRARVGNNVYVGVFSWIGRADIGDDTLLGGHVRVLSGSRHHGFDRLDIPIRLQEGHLRTVTIGSNVWVGNGCVILADISSGSVVAAGAVVTHAFPPNSILAGVPARLVRMRGESGAAGEEKVG